MGFYKQDNYEKYDSSTQNLAQDSVHYNDNATGGFASANLQPASVSSNNLFTGGNMSVSQEPGMLWGTNDVYKWNDITGPNMTGMEKMLAAQTNMSGQAMANQKNSFGGQFGGALSGFSNLAGGVSSIASMFSGFKQLGLMEDQVDIAKDKWKETKKELSRIKGVRQKLNTSYMA